MAAEVVGFGGKASSSGAAFDVPIPSGNNGELLVLFTLNSGTGTCPTPSGWVGSVDVSIPAANSATTQETVRIKWRVRDGTEGANVNIDPSGVCGAFVVAVSGVPTGTTEADLFGAYQTQNSILTNASPLASMGFMAAGQVAVCISWGGAGTGYTAASGGTNITWQEFGDDSNTGAQDFVVNVAAASADTILPGQDLTTSAGGPSANEAFSILINPNTIKDEYITGTGTGQRNAPSNATEVALICIGAGGGGSVSTSAEGGGGGGAYSKTNAISVSSSTIYHSVGTGGAAGAAGNDTWLRVGTNSAPSSTTDGCLAKGGSGGAAAGQGGGAGGVTSTSVGDVKNAGGAGATGQGGGGSRAGSGGGSSAGANNTGNAGSAGSGSTAGAGGTATASGLARGGYGGASGAAGIAGFVPGGGGGGGGNSGGNAGAGAQGRARIVYRITPPATVGRANETDTASAHGMAAGHGQSNETNTAFAPSNPTLVRTIGRSTPAYITSQLYAGTADGSGNAVINMGTLSIKPADTLIVQVAAVTTASTVIGITGDNQGSYIDDGTNYVNGVNDIDMSKGRKFQDGTPDTQLTFSGMAAGQRYVAYVHQFSGVYVSAFAGTDGGQSSNSSNVDPPSHTPGTLADAEFIYYAAAMAFNQSWDTAPGNLNNFTQGDDQAGSGHSARIGFGWVPYVQGSGAFNADAATNSGSTANDTSANTVIGIRGSDGAHERDTAFSRGLNLGVSRSNETDTAFALSQGVIQLPVGQANETDTAFKAGGIAMAPNRPIETDTAFNRGTVLQPQRANEADTAFARPQLGGVGLAVEADTAFALGKAFIKKVGFVSVANGDFDSNYLSEYATFDATIAVVAGRLRVTAQQSNNIQATATFPSIGAALRVGNIVQVSGASFSGTAPATVRLGNGATNAPGQPYLNTSFNVETVLTNTSVKIDCSLNDMGAVTIGQFGEFDNFVITEIPLEVDTAFALNRVDTPAWTRSNETDSAFALVTGFPVVRSNETDSAFARAAIFIRAVSRSNEADTALALTAVQIKPVGFTSEVSTALQPGVGWAVGRANETDSAFARAALLTFDIGRADEFDEAFQMFGALEAGSGRKPYINNLGNFLRDRRQPVHKVS